MRESSADVDPPPPRLRRARRSAFGAKAGRPAPRDRFLAFAVAIFLVSLTVRLVHLFQIRRAPFFTLLMGDAQSYHTWAQQIAAGDWIGSDVFYQAPLYPYFLGVIYAIFGRDLLVVHVVQAIVGSLSCVLVALTAQRLFSERAGFIAGLGLAFYAPAIFFDSLIQKSVLDVFFISLALWILSRPDFLGPVPPTAGPERPGLHTYRSCLALGLTMGALSLTRENALVLVAVAFAWILVRTEVRLKADATNGGTTARGRKSDGTPAESAFRRTFATRTSAASAFALGLAIVLVPVALRNYAVGGGLYLTTSQFGPNFYIGNNETASGTYQPLRFGHGDPKYERQDATELAEQATGRRMTPAEVSRYWTWRALEYIRTQPGDWLELMGRKIMLAWNAAEVADTEDQLSYADWSVLLRVASRVWHFGVLAPLALFGIWATWPRRAELALLYLLPAAYVLALVAFAVMARYRYPLVPFLILFASAGVANFGQLLLAAPRRLVSGLAAAILFASFCNWPMYSMAEMRAITEANVGTELQAQGKLDEAIALYRAALARHPNDVLAHSNLGTALAAKGQFDEAIAQYRTALTLAPNDADSHYNLANALMAQGKLVDAAGEFQEAVRIDPGLVEAYLNLGRLRAEQGRLGDAIELFRRALAINPAYAEARTNLANTHNDLGVELAQENRLDDAIGHFREAIQLAPDHAEAHGNLAMALQIQGKLEDAIRHYQEATRLSPGNREMERRLRAARAARDK